MDTISICICTHNRREELKRCLSSIASQDNLVDLTEVLVIDNASTDGTTEWLENEAMGSFPVRLRTVFEPRLGIAIARNRGFAEIESHIIIWIDDDVTLRPGFIEAHARAFSLPNTALTGGRIFPCFPEGTPDEVRVLFDVKYGGPAAGYDFGEESLVIGLSNGDIHSVPIGANFGLLKAAVKEPKPFDESLGWGKRWVPGEETELFLRLLRKGKIARYVPEAMVDHHLSTRRLNMDYYLKWWLGQGRSELYTTERRPLLHLLSSLKEIITLNMRLRLAKDDLTRNATRGQLARSKGRILEALGR